METVKNLVVVFGIARSGNHAITDWLYSHLDSEKCFFNNINLASPIEKRELYYINETKFFNTENIHEYYRLKYCDEVDVKKVYEARLKEFTVDNDWQVEKTLTLPINCRNLLLSKENLLLTADSITDMHVAEDTFSSHIKNRQAIIILRHPVNLLASRLVLRSKRKDNGERRSYDSATEILNLWKVYANLHLMQAQLPGYQHTHYVTLEEWHTSDLFRQAILNNLGIDKVERRTNIVGLYGGGSSFDGVVTKTQDVQALTLEKRWIQLLDATEPHFVDARKKFIDAFNKHSDTLVQAERIFGSDITKQVVERLKSFHN